MARPRQAIAALATFSTLLWGCGGDGIEKFIPTPAKAQSALEEALTAWKRGLPPGPLPDRQPAIHVVDSYRKPDETLANFRVLGEVPGDTPRCFAVELQLMPRRTEKVRYVVVGIDPLYVFRMEDYQLLAHWEHHMDDEPQESVPPSGAVESPKP